jgi:hypothetical protein
MQIQYNQANAPGVIVTSVAKMNEYYLYNAEYANRQYTMCHEIGHGFGLPHTDENMHNSDMGNCLDYTSTPANNIHPGDVNFDRLASMYLSGYNQEEEYNEHQDYDDENGNGNGKRRFLRRVVYRHYLYV